MTYLIAMLGTGKGTWAQVSALIRQGGFERVILITNQFGKEHFTPAQNTTLVTANLEAPLPILRDELIAALTPLLANLLDTDVALNVVSGEGTQHMALLAAILRLGLGIRLVIAEPGKEGFTEL
jgi:hypothetical protein